MRRFLVCNHRGAKVIYFGNPRKGTMRFFSQVFVIIWGIKYYLTHDGLSYIYNSINQAELAA